MKIETYASQRNNFVKVGMSIKVTNRENLEVHDYKNYLKMPEYLLHDFLQARAKYQYQVKQAHTR